MAVTPHSILGTKNTNAGNPDTFPTREKLPTISVANDSNAYPKMDAVAYGYSLGVANIIRFSVKSPSDRYDSNSHHWKEMARIIIIQ